MNMTILIQKLQVLPEEKQTEVFDFIDYLFNRFAVQDAQNRAEWREGDFSMLSMSQALRGMEDEPDLYTQADLKERWS